jgi:hypothetical protein
MALLFDAAAERVDVGSDASLDNLDPFTWVAWIYPIGLAGTNGIIVKGDGASDFKRLISRADDSVRMIVSCTGVDTDYRSNAAFLTANTWQLLAATYDFGGGAANQAHIYRGTLTSTVVETAYALQQDGTIGVTDDSGGNLYIGNNSFFDGDFDGIIACAMVFDSVLTLAQLRSLQFRFVPQFAGCQGFWHFGFNGTGNQADWSTNTNTGTVTGPTVADHVPVGPHFGFGLPHGSYLFSRPARHGFVNYQIPAIAL